MSRKKRRADRIRMHLRAFEGGEDQYGIRMTTGRMGQEIARLKKSLALRDRRIRMMRDNLKERILYHDYLIAMSKGIFASDGVQLDNAYERRAVLKALLADLESLSAADSSQLDIYEKVIARRHAEVRLWKDEEVSDV